MATEQTRKMRAQSTKQGVDEGRALLATRGFVARRSSIALAFHVRSTEFQSKRETALRLPLCVRLRTTYRELLACLSVFFHSSVTLCASDYDSVTRENLNIYINYIYINYIYIYIYIYMTRTTIT